MKLSSSRARLQSRLLVLALAASLAVLPHATALAQAVQRIAAVVNDAIISSSDLRERLDLAILFSGLEDSPETRRRLAPQVLRRVIDERLQMQEAERLQVRVSDEEVQSAIAQIAQPNAMTTQQLYDYLARRGVQPRTLEEQVRAELAWAKLVRRELGGRIVVTDQLVDLARDAERASQEEEVLLSEIVLPVYAPEQETEALAGARELIDALEEGADFGALARQVSVAASAEQGGDLGWVQLSSVGQGLRPVLAGLEPGEISQPVRSPAGVSIYLARDRRTGSAQDPDQRRLAQIFLPLPADADAASRDLVMTQANGLRSQIASCEDMIGIAERLNAPSSGDLGWISLGELPGDLARILEDQPKGQVTEPVRSATGVHLLMVCGLPGEPVDEAAMRETIRRRLEQEQIQRLANRYLRDLRKDAFIDVRVQI